MADFNAAGPSESKRPRTLPFYNVGDRIPGIYSKVKGITLTKL